MMAGIAPGLVNPSEFPRYGPILKRMSSINNPEGQTAVKQIKMMHTNGGKEKGQRPLVGKKEVKLTVEKDLQSQDQKKPQAGHGNPEPQA